MIPRRIRFTRDAAGYEAGAVVEVPSDAAETWVARGIAEYVRQERTERATRQGGETRRR